MNYSPNCSDVFNSTSVEKKEYTSVYFSSECYIIISSQIESLIVLIFYYISMFKFFLNLNAL